MWPGQGGVGTFAMRPLSFPQINLQYSTLFNTINMSHVFCNENPGKSSIPILSLLLPWYGIWIGGFHITLIETPTHGLWMYLTC